MATGSKSSGSFVYSKWSDENVYIDTAKGTYSTDSDGEVLWAINYIMGCYLDYSKPKSYDSNVQEEDMPFYFYSEKFIPNRFLGFELTQLKSTEKNTPYKVLSSFNVIDTDIDKDFQTISDESWSIFYEKIKELFVFFKEEHTANDDDLETSGVTSGDPWSILATIDGRWGCRFGPASYGTWKLKGTTMIFTMTNFRDLSFDNVPVNKTLEVKSFSPEHGLGKYWPQMLALTYPKK